MKRLILSCLVSLIAPLALLAQGEQSVTFHPTVKWEVNSQKAGGQQKNKTEANFQITFKIPGEESGGTPVVDFATPVRFSKLQRHECAFLMKEVLIVKSDGMECLIMLRSYEDKIVITPDNNGELMRTNRQKRWVYEPLFAAPPQEGGTAPVETEHTEGNYPASFYALVDLLESCPYFDIRYEE
ncbi:MAG: hypothetical protein IJ511_10350 [Bacteroides sp.]|nr:hypothetical protein [Bacteroides sp.]